MHPSIPSYRLLKYPILKWFCGLCVSCCLARLLITAKILFHIVFFEKFYSAVVSY